MDDLIKYKDKLKEFEINQVHSFTHIELHELKRIHEQIFEWTPRNLHCGTCVWEMLTRLNHKLKEYEAGKA